MEDQLIELCLFNSWKVGEQYYYGCLRELIEKNNKPTKGIKKAYVEGSDQNLKGKFSYYIAKKL